MNNITLLVIVGILIAGIYFYNKKGVDGYSNIGFGVAGIVSRELKNGDYNHMYKYVKMPESIYNDILPNNADIKKITSRLTESGII